MINLVQCNDRREFLIGEGIDNLLNRFVRPMLKWLFQTSVRATTAEVLPYPENWPCSVSTAVALTAICRLLNDPHLSIRFPRIHCTISDRSHTMSCEGSYPRVAFPSASVVPLTSTTCTNASACRKSSRNLFPRPFPSCAPGTNPATSRSSIGTDRRPSTHAP